MIRARIVSILALAIQPAVLAVAASSTTVTQSGRAFSVRDIHIRRGDVVHFNNADEFLHQIYVRSSSFNFASAEQEPGRIVDVQFSVAGHFEVRCEIHPRMLLNVSVE